MVAFVVLLVKVDLCWWFVIAFVAILTLCCQLQLLFLQQEKSILFGLRSAATTTVQPV